MGQDNTTIHNSLVEAPFPGAMACRSLGGYRSSPAQSAGVDEVGRKRGDWWQRVIMAAGACEWWNNGRSSER